MPMGDGGILAGLLGLGKGGGGRPHGGGGRFRGGGGWWGGGPWWEYGPVLYAEDLMSTAHTISPAQGAKVLQDALAMKTDREQGSNRIMEVYDGPAGQPILTDKDLPAASSGYTWVISTGESKKNPGVRGTWILYLKQ